MKHMMKTFGLVYFLLFCLCLYSQEIPANMEEFIADMYEQFTEETGEEPDYETFFTELMHLSEHPVNINDTDREQLSKLMFLSDIQIENLLYYLYRAEKIYSLYELQLVEGFDMTDIRRILPFIYLGESKNKEKSVDFSKLLQYGKNEVISRFDLVPEHKAGYIASAEGKPAYAGNALYHHFKYRFAYNNRFFLNFTAEKDAGEQFFRKKMQPYDFTGFSFQYQSKNFIRSLIIGDFKASFGQGLVLSQEFGKAKSSQTTSIMSRTSGFSRSGSTNEHAFFRGLAATLSHGNFKHHLFISQRKLDANVVEKVFSTIYTSGLHRTEQEIAGDNSLLQFTSGVNTVFSNLYWQAGLSVTYNHYDKSHQIRYYPYNHFYFQGKNQLVAGLHYRFKLRKTQFFGETATSGFNGIATLNGLLFYPTSTVHLVLLQRYYTPEYNALFAKAFSEGSRVSNESGWYIGLNLLPAPRWNLSAYADLYRFPWLKYGADAAVTGSDFLLQAQYSPKRQLSMLWRFKYEVKAVNDPGGFYTTNRLITSDISKLRYQLSLDKGDLFFRYSMEINCVDKQNAAPTFGFSAMQDIGYRFQNIPLKIDVRYQFFDASVYDNRIYSYEKDVLYAFSFPAHSGKGVRYYLNMKFQIPRNLSLYFRFAQTIYTDHRESIGTAHELIQGNVKTELKLLFRWKFQFK